MKQFLIVMNSDHTTTEYNKITEQIYLGTNLCCGVIAHSDFLKQQGINVEINLEEERLINPPDIDVYLWLPVKDLHAPTQYQLTIGVKMLDEIVKTGQRVYVHCKLGMGRSPTLLTAYFISTGMTLEEALMLVKEKRPATDLTEEQFNALVEFESHLK